MAGCQRLPGGQTSFQEFPPSAALTHSGQGLRLLLWSACSLRVSDTSWASSSRPREKCLEGGTRRTVEHLRARSQLYLTHPRQTSHTSSLPQPWHSPGSLLMGLAGSLGAVGTLRLALCSFQYSRQCRSWEWMKRHMSQAWATHTNSSMPSLWRGRDGSKGRIRSTACRRRCGGNQAGSL